MTRRNVLLAFAVASVSVMLSAQVAPDVEVAVVNTPTTFLPGESISVVLEVRNFSDQPIVEPIADDWVVEVRNGDGELLEDFSNAPYEGRFWSFDDPVTFTTIEPGGARTQVLPIQMAFLLFDEGEYSAVFSARITRVEDGQPQALGPFDAVASAPFSFEISSSSIVWEEAIRPLVFRVVDTSGALSLQFYRGPFVESDDPLVSDYTIIAELDSASPPPELSQAAAMTASSGWVGAKFVAGGVTMCAIVDLDGDLVKFTPPVPIAGSASCGPP